MATRTELEALRTAIWDAFSDNTYPGDDNIVGHDCNECEQVRAALRGHDWSTVDPTVVQRNHDKLPLLTPEAHRFFLPAYLHASLDGFGPDNDVLEFTVYNLCPDRRSLRSNAEHHQQRLAAFSAKERGVIRDFLQMVARDVRSLFDDAERGLRWWSDAGA